MASVQRTISKKECTALQQQILNQEEQKKRAPCPKGFVCRLNQCALYIGTCIWPEIYIQNVDT